MRTLDVNLGQLMLVPSPILLVPYLVLTVLVVVEDHSQWPCVGGRLPVRETQAAPGCSGQLLADVLTVILI